MAQTKKTDNHYTKDKIQLRINAIKNISGDIRLLDCYAGHGVVWKSIIKNCDKKIVRMPFDSRDDMTEFHFHGENETFLAGLDLSKFNVIDLDAYGVPYQQLKILFEKNFKGTVFVTFIQTMQGGLPHEMLEQIGFTKEMIQKSPTLFSKQGFDKIKQYLAINRVTKISHRSKNRKHYFSFVID